jgi:hypothetical protein
MTRYCTTCGKEAIKQYLFIQEFYYRCGNVKCKVWDIDNPETVKPNYEPPEEPEIKETKKEPEKKSLDLDVWDDDFFRS